MIVTTTPTVEGYRITGYYGIVFGEVITGINFLKDFGAGIRNLVGGRSAGYEEELMVARTQAREGCSSAMRGPERPMPSSGWIWTTRCSARATCSWSPPPAPPSP